MDRVKGRRRYNSTGRQEQARRNREAVLDAAERLFLADGYGPTTIAAIASEAGVSVETVYKTFGGKTGLVRALYERGLTGRGPIPAYERSDRMRAEQTDPETIMREWGALTAEVASVVTPIRLLIRSAAITDPEMATLLADSDDERLIRMRHHAVFLGERGYLREGVTTDEATDILWTCSSVELYELLVLRRGWSSARFARFVGEFMISALLPESRA
ncbi:TetR/AcrR family transcriptional regulator [Saccharothrix deserti]|uniref:TetR/AcrR family transcriptional regulator n=1 Tax=Saccharothrix deserti TaxID=2593674 RepID=UPI00192E3D18|nr:TetR/AcrR family transcriptional regulator [Saccharothrix deserti]